MRDFYTRLCSNVIFPLHERAKGHRSVAMLRELMQSQWHDAEQLAQLRIARLRDLLAFAGTNVPYYRDTFARLHFDPSRVTSLDDLARLPLLTKDVMRGEGDRMGTAVAVHHRLDRRPAAFQDRYRTQKRGCRGEMARDALVGCRHR